jgi:hypothetical protein
VETKSTRMLSLLYNYIVKLKTQEIA